MSETMVQAAEEAGPLEIPRWKAWTCAISAVLLAIVLLVSGIWKITDPLAAAVRMTQALVPPVLSLPAALAFGIAEAFAGVLLLAPRFRRWGAWLAGLLLVAFLVYIGVFYDRLRGEDCNCFPWVRRVVGPVFFAGDGVMLLMAAAAGWWARPSQGKRTAAIVLGAVCVFAAVSYGVTATRQTAFATPPSVIADGTPFPLREGRVFVYFFNPECLHCAHVARDLAKLNWGETRVLGAATSLVEYGPEFMRSAQWNAVCTDEVAPLREVFQFVDVPYGVALENGRVRASFSALDFDTATETLRQLGFVR